MKPRKMVEALLGCVSQADLSADSSGKIVLANRSAEEMLAYTREMLLPESKRWVHDQHREQYFAQPRVRPMGTGISLSARHSHPRWSFRH